MFAVKGYFDGHNYVTEGNVAVKPNQRVIITFLDEMKTEEKKSIADDWLSETFALMDANPVYSNGVKWSREELYER